MFSNPYQAYAAGTVASSNPMQLIIKLYEGCISTVQEAQRCFQTGDIMGRAGAVTKGIDFLSELLGSLNHEKGGEISANLQRLYGYMQTRLLDAHLKKTPEPLVEVEGLLRSLLEAWCVVAEKEGSALQGGSQAQGFTEAEVATGTDDVLRITYGGYYREPVESFSAVAYSF